MFDITHSTINLTGAIKLLKELHRTITLKSEVSDFRFHSTLSLLEIPNRSGRYIDQIVEYRKCT